MQFYDMNEVLQILLTYHKNMLYLRGPCWMIERGSTNMMDLRKAYWMI